MKCKNLLEENLCDFVWSEQFSSCTTSNSKVNLTKMTWQIADVISRMLKLQTAVTTL